MQRDFDHRIEQVLTCTQIEAILNRLHDLRGLTKNSTNQPLAVPNEVNSQTNNAVNSQTNNAEDSVTHGMTGRHDCISETL